MATVTLPSVLESRPAATAKAEQLRWLIPLVLVATTSILTGAIWDISWHMTVGRDTLWTAPHLLEQLGAATAGMACGACVLWTTFRGSPELQAATVRFWGFRGPFGAWVCIWGALTMIASVPFDNWWHNAYGLDVQIMSPPHTVLMLGMFGIQVGALLIALAMQNRAEGGRDVRIYGTAFTYATGALLIAGSLAFYEFIAYPNEWHRSGFYRITAVLFPFVLAGVARAGRLRFPATATAATYMIILMLQLWILQLVPATPMLAPIYNPVDHMVPLTFPLVLIAPAIVIDLIVQRMRARSDWLVAATIGSAFVVTMLAVHWPFGEFMLSPAARNHFFGADQWPYMYRLGPWTTEFWRLDLKADGSWDAAAFGVGLAVSMVLAFISARLGLWWGNWTRRVRR